MSVNVMVLASGPGWHVRDLQRAADIVGCQLRIGDFRRIAASVATGMETPLHQPELLGEPGWATNAVLVRTMPPGTLEQIIFRMDVLHRCQASGIAVFNGPRALETCIDKYLTTARLAAAGLCVPETWVGQDADSALVAWERLGGDVVVKPIFGSEGRGILRVQERELARRVFGVLERLGAVLYLQRYVEHEGYDLRVFVLGETVLAAMRRYARNDFRTNVAQGGQAEAVSLTAAETRAALQAAACVGAEIAGVDLLPARNGQLFVLEVNAVPGWRALSRVSHCDIAAEVLRYIRGRIQH
jgi:RimK family alpha-L-glutamate ligase